MFVSPVVVHDRASDTPAERLRGFVVDQAAREFAVTAASILTPGRGAPRVALARQAAMYLLHTIFGLSQGQIARLFGRDRTTVTYACRVIEEGRDDTWMECRLAALEGRCRAVSSVSADRNGAR